jgi:hypothetical protein
MSVIISKILLPLISIEDQYEYDADAPMTKALSSLYEEINPNKLDL